MKVILRLETIPLILIFCVISVTALRADEKPLACPFSVDSSHVDVTCWNGFDGEIQIDIPDGVPPYDFDWNDDTYDDPNVSGLVVLEDLFAGTYSVTITDAMNCMDTLEFLLREPEEFLPDCSDVTFPSSRGAEDGTLNLTFEGGVSPYTVEWLDEDQNLLGSVSGLEEYELFIENLPAANIIVRVIDVNGCITTCTASLLLGPCDFGVESSKTDNLCIGDQQGSISINILEAEEPIEYDWSADAYDGLSELTDLAGGSYSLTVTDAVDCDSIMEFTIDEGYEWELLCRQIHEQSGVDVQDGAIETEIINPRFPLQVEISGAIDSSVTLNDEAILRLDSLGFGDYFITVEDSEGCALECAVSVEIDLPRPQIYIPNAFSPDGNGVNDIFEIYPNEAIAQLHRLEIYDRWGSLVYEVNRERQELLPFTWNGLSKGKPCLPGVYVYSVEAETLLGERISRNGDLLLLR